ncbi:MAG: polysaccharide biosynthesis tyrosine autokinase [Clostridia bacterium]|nr:polysaccharide biosynthesis tyrosine autokinase [Clostridia bacterium]
MKEINFSFLLYVLKKHWWKVVSITLVAMIGAALFTHFLIPKKYSSSVKFYVLNINTDHDYTSANNLAASEYLVSDYIEIINSNTLLSKISEKLTEEGYQNVTVNSIGKMFNSSATQQNSIFTITVSHTDKKLAYRTAQLLEEFAPSVVTEIAKPTDTTGFVIASKTQAVINQMEIDGAFPKGTDLPTLEQIQHFLELSGESMSRLECIAVLTPPVEATTHDSPNLTVNTLLAGLFAAVFSYSFFLIISYVISTLVTENDVKSVTKMPLMAAVPHWNIPDKTTKEVLRKGKKQKNIVPSHSIKVLNEQTPFTVFETFNQLRTNLIYATPADVKCPVYAITSVREASGKSTVITNLAISFSQIGKRVLLIDGDMRCPTIHSFFELNKRSKGLSELILGIENDVIVHDIRPGLDVITSGRISTNPSNLLNSAKLRELIAEWKDSYDAIFFDFPPMGIVSDCVVISDEITGYLFSILSNGDNAKNVLSTLDAMKQVGANIFGSILNDYNLKASGYYSYRYKYNYKYRSRYTSAYLKQAAALQRMQSEEDET